MLPERECCCIPLYFYDQNISYFLDIHLSSDNHFCMMYPSEKKFHMHNMLFATYQLYNTDGNVLVCCGRGRTRSPAYLIAYCIRVLGLSFNSSFDKVNRAFQEQRKEYNYTVDRDERFFPFLRRLETTFSYL